MDGSLPGVDFALAELAEHFQEVRARTEAMAEPLTEADCQVQSMDDASPVKWHLAHTTWFWETFVLKAHAGIVTAPDPRWDFLFNSYYEAVGPRHARPERGLITRPRPKEVMAYRRSTTEAMLEFAEAPGESADALVKLLEIGIAHEQQHQELVLTDLKHAMSCNPLWPAVYIRSEESRAKRGPLADGWTGFEGGLTEIGHTGEGFGFDNEFPRHKVWLEPFELSNRLVTNGEVLGFMEAGGYRDASLWLSDGWAWVNHQARRHPDYWRVDGYDVEVYTLAGPEPLDSDAPAAHLSAYEADAIARFLGARLPTEAEWEAAASEAPAGRPAVSAGESPAPQPLTGRGLQGFFGEVWQWTSSSYTAYPGYKQPAGAIGEYNGKFMSGQQVLRGSSCATSPGHARRSYRNFFHAPDTWQFTGLRLARDG